MSNNPFNLAIRFILELFILYAIGHWAWQKNEGVLRYILVILLPIFAAALWGAFRAPADHGKGLVAVPGWVRLLLELFLFAVAYWCLEQSGSDKLANVFLIVSLLHYIVSYDRILLLLRN